MRATEAVEVDVVVLVVAAVGVLVDIRKSTNIVVLFCWVVVSVVVFTSPVADDRSTGL